MGRGYCACVAGFVVAGFVVAVTPGFVVAV
jgi:hypothetical protein